MLNRMSRRVTRRAAAWLLLTATLLLNSCVAAEPEPEAEPNLLGRVTHLDSGEGLAGVRVDALTGASAARRVDSAVTDELGVYQMTLSPRLYLISPAVPPAEDCLSTLEEVAVMVELDVELYEIDFSYLPAPCE